MERLRSIYNAVDQFLDRASIRRELRRELLLRDEDRPRTAAQALKSVLPAVRVHDRGAQLKRIGSPQGLDGRGASAHWEFFFDLPARRAQLACDWGLTWDERGDPVGPARLTITIRPFPPQGSLLRRMVQEGKLLYRQLEGPWREELLRSPALPLKFRDTDLALDEFIGQGLDPSQHEFTVGTGQRPERGPCWLAQTRERTFYAGFS